MTKRTGKHSALRAMRMAALAALPLLSVAAAAPAVADSGRSQDYYRDALEWLQKGDGRAALIQLRNAVKEDPDNFSARLLLGRLYLESGDLAAARKELEIAHNGAPSDETEVYYGRALLAAGEFDAVLATVRDDANQAEYLAAKRLLRAEALSGLGRQDEAMQQAQQVLASEPNHPQGNLVAARIKASQGDIAAAQAHVDAALAGKADYLEAYLMRAQLRYGTQDLDGTLKALDQAEELAPDDPRAKLLRIETLIRMGQLSEAADLAKAYREANQNDVRGTYLLARIYATQGRYEEADQELGTIPEAVRNIPSASLLAGTVKFQLGQYAQADQALERYIGTAGAEARQARRLLATIQLRTQRPRVATQTLAPLVGPDSNDVASLQLAASAYLRTGELNRAKALFERIMQRGAPADVRQAQSFYQALQTATPDVTGRLQLEPVELRSLVVLDMLRHGEDGEALKEALKLADEYPDDPTVANLVAGIYLARSEFQTARKALEPALASQPDNAGLQRTMNRIDIAEGKFDAVEARLRDAVQARPKDETAILQLGQFLSYRGRRDEAVTLLRSKAEELPQSLQLRQALLTYNLSMNNAEAVRQLAKEALAIGEGGKPEGYLLAGETFLALQDYAAAADSFERLVAVTGDATGPLLKLAEAQTRGGQADAAAATLDRVLAKEPANPAANQALVLLRLREKDSDAAMAAAERAGEANPVLGLQLQALVYQQTDRADEGVRLLRDALQTQPASALAQQAFRLLIQSDKADEGVAMMSAWLVEHPDDTEALQLLSAQLIRQRQYEEAASYLERAYSLLPNNPIVLNNLAWVRYELQRPGALTIARRAYRLAPNSPAITDTLGWILVQEGEVEEGLKLLYTANEAAPEIGDIAYHLAVALDKTGKRQEAIDVLERALNGAADVTFDQDRENAEALLGKLKTG